MFALTKKMVTVWHFVVEDHHYRDEQKENSHVQHNDVQKSTVIDVWCQFISFEEICAYFSHNTYNIKDLVSLAAQLKVGLLRHLLTTQSFLKSIFYEFILLVYLLLTIS